MISPLNSWLRFAQAILLGMGMGPVADLLEAPRRKVPVAADLCISLWMVILWLMKMARLQ